MEKITTSVALRAKIDSLETERRSREQALKQELHAAHEWLQPANVAKRAIKDVFSSKELGGSLLDQGMGLLSGYLTRKAVAGSSKNPIKIILGALLGSAVSGQVAEHGAPLRDMIVSALRTFLNKKEQKPE